MSGPYLQVSKASGRIGVSVLRRISMLPRLFGRACNFAVWAFAIAALSILCAGQAYAQVAGATLTGTVKDSSGAVIPNAQVTITDVATGVTRTVSPGSAGLYTAPNLL